MSEPKKKQPKKYPYEYPQGPERYTQQIVAVDRIEPGGPDGTFTDCHRHRGESDAEKEARLTETKQNSDYDDNNKAAPDNNIFFEERSNPLSSKGN